MDSRTEAIKADINAVIDKLDALRSGQNVDNWYLIERGIGQQEAFIRDELSLIDEAIK